MGVFFFGEYHVFFRHSLGDCPVFSWISWKNRTPIQNLSWQECSKNCGIVAWHKKSNTLVLFASTAAYYLGLSPIECRSKQASAPQSYRRMDFSSSALLSANFESLFEHFNVEPLLVFGLIGFPEKSGQVVQIVPCPSTSSRMAGQALRQLVGGSGFLGLRPQNPICAAYKWYLYALKKNISLFLDNTR